MKDMQRMMKEAQKMAAEMQKVQAEIAEMEVEGSAGGGAVKVRASGEMRISEIVIDPGFFDGPPEPEDVEMLGDTVTAAVNDALEKIKEAQSEAMGPLAGGLGGMGLPGL